MKEEIAKKCIAKLGMHIPISDTCVLIPAEAIRDVLEELDKWVFTHGYCFHCNGPISAADACKQCGYVPFACKCPDWKERKL